MSAVTKTSPRRKGVRAEFHPATDRSRLRRDPVKVLIALDGSRASNAALRFARRMAKLGAWAPDAITVSQPLPTYVGEFVLPAPPMAQEEMRNSVLLQLRSQLRRHGLPSWPASVRFGPTGWSIIEAARELGAQLIVVGLGRHGRVARLFGAETAGRIARKSDVPLLAVHSNARGLPRVAVVAMDFGESSIAAAREALQILQPGGELHLVHAMSSYNVTTVAGAGWKEAYADAVQMQFVRVVERLEPMIAGIVKTKLVVGEAVDAVTAYARSARADLIAAGSHNQGLVERMLLGSTTAELLRAASCSVLVAPSAGRASDTRT